MMNNISSLALLSEGYLLVDSTLCSGCRNCMLVCSLVHYGKFNLSLARIRIVEDIQKPFPVDISIRQCRQCASPACVDACPTEALYIDTNNGNIRVVDEEQCSGCMKCIEACPYTPPMMIWNSEKEVAIKCDLCLNTSYWNEKGGPHGKQACVEVCPMKAIIFTSEPPSQTRDEGYEIDLRGEELEEERIGH